MMRTKLAGDLELGDFRQQPDKSLPSFELPYQTPHFLPLTHIMAFNA